MKICELEIDLLLLKQLRESSIDAFNLYIYMCSSILTQLDVVKSFYSVYVRAPVCKNREIGHVLKFW